MSKSIYINIVTKNIAKSTAFYEAISCVKNPMFSNDDASSVAWSEEMVFMILTEDFAQNFTDGKTIAD